MDTSTENKVEVQRVPDQPGSRPGYKFVLWALGAVALFVAYLLLN